MESGCQPLERARVAKLRAQGTTIREVAVAVCAPRAMVTRYLSQNVPTPAPPVRPSRRRPGVAAQK